MLYGLEAGAGIDEYAFPPELLPALLVDDVLLAMLDALDPLGLPELAASR